MAVIGTYMPGNGPWNYAAKIVTPPVADQGVYYCVSNGGKGLSAAQPCNTPSLFGQCSNEHDADLDMDVPCQLR